MSAFFQSIIERGGGLIACGEHLGVFVSSGENALACPAGWAFVPIHDATVDGLREVVEQVKLGRSAWPTKENGDRPK